MYVCVYIHMYTVILRENTKVFRAEVFWADKDEARSTIWALHGKSTGRLLGVSLGWPHGNG